MSYPIEPYNPNNAAVMNPQFNLPIFNSNSVGGEEDLLRSVFGLANRLIAEVLQNSLDIGGMASLRGFDPYNAHAPVFGMSAMNVTQISCGPDGRPHIVQTHNERRMGPGGIFQTKKALRDPERGIEKMQVGYFIGDRGEIIERRLDPSTGQYQQEIQRYGMPTNESSFTPSWRNQAQPSMQRLPPVRPQQYQYYSPQRQQVPAILQQSQFSPYSQQLQLAHNPQQSLQALPAPSSYPYL